MDRVDISTSMARQTNTKVMQNIQANPEFARHETRMKGEREEVIGMIGLAELVGWKDHLRVLRLKRQLLVGRAPWVVIKTLDVTCLATE